MTLVQSYQPPMPPMGDFMPQDDTAKQHGRYLEERRLDLGVRWSEVARDMERLHGVSVSADYLSKIKRGAAPLAKMSVDAREALRQVLRIPTEEWANTTGLYTPAAAGTPPPRRLTDAERRGWVLPEDDDEPEIPETLLIAAQKYGHGDNAPFAERRWLRELSELDFREEPETPEDWLAIYSRLSKLIDPKDN